MLNVAAFSVYLANIVKTREAHARRQ